MHLDMPHLASCPWASSLSRPFLRTPPRLSPRPAPRCFPWTAAGPSGWASSPQTPPRSTPGPHCADSFPHLSPCREETRGRGSFFYTTLQQRPPCSPLSLPTTAHAPTSPGMLSAGAPVLPGAAAAGKADVPEQWHGLFWDQQQCLLPSARLGPGERAALQAPTEGGDQKKVVLLKVPTAAPSRAIA